MSINRGDEFTAKVVDLSFEGKSVLRADSGMMFFSEGAWPGEVGRFRVRDFEKNYGYADLIEIEDKSDVRRAPPCDRHGIEKGDCGGCPWMSISYDAQLAQKRIMLVDAMKRVKTEALEDQVCAVRPSPDEWGYRSRAQLKTDGKSLGFLSNRSHQIVHVEDCVVMAPSLRSKLKVLSAQVPRDEWRPKGKKRWNFIDLDENMKDVRLNRRSPFRQTNSSQNEYMKSWLVEKMNVPSQSDWVELFAGNGNFTSVIAQAGAKKISVIEVHSGVRKIKTKLPQCEINPIICDLFQPRVWENLSVKYPEIKNCDSMLLDPPRKGLFYRTGFVELFKNLKNVYYVSCNIGSFVRDLRFFEKMGFVVEEIQPVDQFPQTPHLEMLCVLRRA